MILDFEKPIADLEAKLKQMEKVAEDNKVDVSVQVKELTDKIKKLKKETYTNLTPWQKVQLSRHPDRPYTLDYIYNMCDNFIELHGDRYFGDDKAMVGGFGEMKGKTYMFIGQQKGRNTKARQERNFGMSNPEGYRKALRLMKLAEKFNKPIITLIDTPGAFPGMEAEERGQAEAIARNLYEMAGLKVPVICIIIGEGASGGAIGIGVGDQVLMLENTWYSVISPESCSSILWRSWEYKEQAAEALRLTATDMLSFKLIDGIIKEPVGGAQSEPEAMYKTLKREISSRVAELEKLDPKKLVEKRIEKFSSMGVIA